MNLVLRPRTSTLGPAQWVHVGRKSIGVFTDDALRHLNLPVDDPSYNVRSANETDVRNCLSEGDYGILMDLDTGGVLGYLQQDCHEATRFYLLNRIKTQVYKTWKLKESCETLGLRLEMPDKPAWNDRAIVYNGTNSVRCYCYIGDDAWVLDP